MRRAIFHVMNKELRIAYRQSVVLVLGILFLLLTVLSFYASYISFQKEQHNISREKQEKREQWLNQGDKHPHIAAHYGTYVFKPKSVLGIFDHGLDAYTGTSIYLEAHYQHEFMFRPAQDKGTMVRFGELTMAMILQVLMPLFIIIMSFRSISEERESGTLRLMAAQGIPIRNVLWGKVVAYVLILMMILLPVLIVTAIGITAINPSELLDLSPWRMLLLLISYGIYLFLFIAISVFTSLYSKTSRNALMSLLVFWVLFTVLVPKTVANLGNGFYALPSMHTFRGDIQTDIDNGLDGNTPRSARMEMVKKQTLEAYEVDSIHLLPVNFGGISMQAGEDYGSQVYDVHHERLHGIFDKQNKLFAYSSLLDPFIAIQRLSMAFSGTDMYTAVDFENEVEHYRRELVRKMNNDMAQNSRYGEFFEYKAGGNLWEQIEDFSYQMPQMFPVIRAYRIEIMGLFLWFFATLLFLLYGTSQIKWNV